MRICLVTMAGLPKDQVSNAGPLPGHPNAIIALWKQNLKSNVLIVEKVSG
jgi:hypothetical protein